MTAKLDYRWKLRDVMADQGMFATATLRPLLAERGITLSPSQVYRLVTERPARLSLPILMALLDILQCRMDDLIEPIARGQRIRNAGGQSTGPDSSQASSGVGIHRPSRARVVARTPKQ